MRDVRVTAGGVTVLDVPSLEIRHGEILALLGPNGAGKSTLIHALALLVRPDSGTIGFKGEPVRHRGDLVGLRRRMAVVLQEPFLMDTTVERNVASGLEFRRARDVEARVHAALELLGITHLAGRSAHRLSGGEAARVSLARAFALEPEITMLDEPFSSLDAPTRQSLLGDVESILRATGVTTVMSTHDSSEALRLADRIAVMSKGTIVQIGPADEIMTRPVNEFVARFVGVETILSGEVVAREGPHAVVSVGGTRLVARSDVEPGREVLLCIRPECVHLGTEPHGPASVLEGRVGKIVPMGHHAIVHVDCGPHLAASVVEARGLTPGLGVTAWIDPDSIHVIPRCPGRGEEARDPSQ
jgi:tungstate transport system ATP-binding protein